MKRQRATSGNRRGQKKARVAYRQPARPSGIYDEVKFFDTETVDDAFTATWATMEPATTNLSAVAQGDGESARDGRKYRIHGIFIKGYVEHTKEESTASPTGDQVVRICLVQDKQTNGAQMTATDCMDSGVTYPVLSFRNLQHTERFNVLFDKTIRIPTEGMNEGAVNLFAHATKRIPFKINHAFKTPIIVNTDGTTADIANVTTNSLHMIGVSRDASSCLLNYTSRVRFTG